MTLLDFAEAAAPVLLVAGAALMHIIYYRVIARVPTQMQLKQEPVQAPPAAQPVKLKALHEESAA